jgi:hypothetical protein
MTETDFVKSEIAVWGEDYIFSLIERGYSPVLTDNGWFWLLTQITPSMGLDIRPEVCYTDGAMSFSRWT